MRFCSMFGALCGNFYFKLRFCGFTKPSSLRYLEIFEIISTRFAVFFCKFFALFICNLCDFAVFVSPLAPSVKVELN